MAIFSINRLSRSTYSTKNSVSLASKSIKNISNILTNRISSRKKISSSILSYKNKRLQNELRQEERDEISASSRVISPGGSRSLVLSQVGGSFVNRIVGFIGYTAAGWLLSNMPTWIGAGKELYMRIASLDSTLSGFVSNIGQLIGDIGSISNAFYQNMIAFDLSDSSYRIRNSLDDLNNTFDSMGNQIAEAFDVITQPFTNVPPLGSKGKPDVYPEGQPPQPSPSGGNADFWTLVAIVSREDGDPQGQADVAQSIYNRVAAGVFPGGKDIKKVILARTQYQPTREYPKRNPSGNTNPEWYQITDAESAAKATGYDVNTIKSVAKNITNPTLQKKAAEYIENRTDFLGKGITPDRKSSTELRRRNRNDNIFGNFVGPASFEYGRKTAGKPSPSISQPSSTTSQTPGQAKPSPETKSQTIKGKTPGYSQAVAFGKSLLSKGYKFIWQHPDFNWDRGYTGSGKERVAERGNNSYHNYGEALDISAYNGEGKLDALYSHLDKNRSKYGIAELLWRVKNHYDHLHIAFNKLGSTLTSSVSQKTETAKPRPSVSSPSQTLIPEKFEGTFIQGSTGRSTGDHFHIGPTELYDPETNTFPNKKTEQGKRDAREAAFKVAKALIAKKENFTFSNAGINVNSKTPPSDDKLMEYIQKEQNAHANRSMGGSWGGIDIVGRSGIKLPLPVGKVSDRGGGFGNSAKIIGTNAFVGHGAKGSKSSPQVSDKQSTLSSPLIQSSDSQTSQSLDYNQIQSNELDSKRIDEVLKNINFSKKQKIIFVNDLQTSSPEAPVYSKSGGGSISGGIDEIEVLNSFIKHKFLLDLNYL